MKRASLGLLPRFWPPNPPCIPPCGITWPREAPPGAKLPRLEQMQMLMSSEPNPSQGPLQWDTCSSGLFPVKQQHRGQTRTILGVMTGDRAHTRRQCELRKLNCFYTFPTASQHAETAQTHRQDCLTRTSLPGSSCDLAPSDQTCFFHHLENKRHFSHSASQHRM